jgi:hypothetical protein
VLLKAYFDGGNKLDSTRYDYACLASVCAQAPTLKRFENEWSDILDLHKAAYLHTSDAIALAGTYKGWTERRRDAFVADCAKLIQSALFKSSRSGVVEGLILSTISLDLKAFRKVRDEIPRGPQDASEVISTQSFTKILECAGQVGAHFIELLFDRNEPYRGHIVDRIRNPLFIRQMKENNIDLERRVIMGPELDMRDTPMLQAADLLAWCACRRKRPTLDWHKEVLSIRRADELIEESHLRQPDPLTVSFVQHCKFSKRRPTP